jgi:hypothetical protein
VTPLQYIFAILLVSALVLHANTSADATETLEGERYGDAKLATTAKSILDQLATLLDQSGIGRVEIVYSGRTPGALPLLGQGEVWGDRFIIRDVRLSGYRNELSEVLRFARVEPGPGPATTGWGVIFHDMKGVRIATIALGLHDAADVAPRNFPKSIVSAFVNDVPILLDEGFSGWLVDRFYWAFQAVPPSSDLCVDRLSAKADTEAQRRIDAMADGLLHAQVDFMRYPDVLNPTTAVTPQQLEVGFAFNVTAYDSSSGEAFAKLLKTVRLKTPDGRHPDKLDVRWGVIVRDQHGKRLGALYLDATGTGAIVDDEPVELECSRQLVQWLESRFHPYFR